MEPKKISFGFSKLMRKPNLLLLSKGKEKEEPKIELVKCFEGQEIKLLEEKVVETALVIPLKENTKTSAALASSIKRRAVLLDETDDSPSEESATKTHLVSTNGTKESLTNVSLEERATRELLAAVQSNGREEMGQNLVVPTLKADKLPLNGAKQSSMDDYESMPIEQFGKAMLRGMGWVQPVLTKNSGPPGHDVPFVRPKGMGLGADKALKKQPLLVAPEKNEVLEIKKLAYVRILGGKNKDLYGQIEGFDDYAGRAIVKMAIGGAKVAFSKFLCQAVSKKEYAQYGKCINKAKYEEYKRMENDHGKIIIKTERPDKSKIKKKCYGQDCMVMAEKDDSDKRDKDTNLLNGQHIIKIDEKLRTKREVDGHECKHNSEKADRNIEPNLRDREYVRERSGRQSNDNSRRNYREELGSKFVETHSDKSKEDYDKQSTDHQQSYRDEDYNEHNNLKDDAIRRGVYTNNTTRRPDIEVQRFNSNRRERYDESHNEHKKYEYEHDRSTRREYCNRSSRRQQYTDDTSVSSGTDNDSDSAYEHRHKKKSNHKSSKSKPKKSSKKLSYRKKRYTDTERDNLSKSDNDEDANHHRRKKEYKKKTKRSRKPRSRSRSFSHDRRGRT